MLVNNAHLNTTIQQTQSCTMKAIKEELIEATKTHDLNLVRQHIYNALDALLNYEVINE